MIKKCDHPGCPKAGTCRAPKTRELKEYWLFCREHAAEYNKNWNYYAGMSPDEIEAEWEREVFGAPLKDKATANADAADYAKFINDFLTGRPIDAAPARRTLPGPVTAALKTLDLPLTASLRDAAAKYRTLAKRYHPDTARDKKRAAEKFAEISAAYDTLKKYFSSK